MITDSTKRRFREKLTQRLTLNIEKRNNITVLRQHFNLRRLNDLIVQYQK